MLALIPARGGSKGIPRKNIRPFLGRPLLAWSVEAALASGACERVVVSTEDAEIAAAARAAGAEVVDRPQDLASDDAGTAAVARHAVEALADNPDYVLILEPTSPARRPRHVREAAQLLRDSGADTVASVSEVPHHFVAEKQLRLGAQGELHGLDGTYPGEMTHRRQDLDATYAFDGLVFACRTELLLRDRPTIWGPRAVGYVVEQRYAIDLDSEEDWAPAEARVRAILEQEPA